MNRKLPIDKLTESNFNSDFKQKYLDKEKLDDKSIRKIKKLFKIGDKETARICCDDYHTHDYGCIYYYIPVAGVVERLIIEIKNYRKIHNDISKKLSEE